MTPVHYGYKFRWVGPGRSKEKKHISLCQVDGLPPTQVSYTLKNISCVDCLGKLLDRKDREMATVRKQIATYHVID